MRIPFILFFVFLLSGLMTACDSNNSMVEGEDRSSGTNSFALSPGRAILETGDMTVVFRITGGEEPLSWSVSDPSLGTIPETTGRTVTYTRTAGREGVNVIQVRQRNVNQDRADVLQESPAITPAPFLALEAAS